MPKKLKPLKVIKNKKSKNSKPLVETVTSPVYIIDWDKVVSIDEVKIILKELNLSINIERATEDIKPLLKQVT